jgi:hypothetical protein
LRAMLERVAHKGEWTARGESRAVTSLCRPARRKGSNLCLGSQIAGRYTSCATEAGARGGNSRRWYR